MEEFLQRMFEHLIGRIHGPLTFRFALQPGVAIFLAVRAGLRDAREGHAPYFWALLHDPAHRRAMIDDGWHDIWKVLLLTSVLDCIYQVIVLRWIYPGEALIMAACLALLPYLIFRGLVTHIARLGRNAPPSQPTSGTQP